MGGGIWAECSCVICAAGGLKKYEQQIPVRLELSHRKTTNESSGNFEFGLSGQHDVGHFVSVFRCVYPNTYKLRFSLQRDVVTGAVVEATNGAMYHTDETHTEIKQTDQVSVFHLKGVEIDHGTVERQITTPSWDGWGWIHTEEDETIFIESRKGEVDTL